MHSHAHSHAYSLPLSFSLTSRIDQHTPSRRAYPRLLHIFVNLFFERRHNMDEIKHALSTTVTHAFDMSKWYKSCLIHVDDAIFRSFRILLDPKSPGNARLLDCNRTRDSIWNLHRFFKLRLSQGLQDTKNLVAFIEGRDNVYKYARISMNLSVSVKAGTLVETITIVDRPVCNLSTRITSFWFPHFNLCLSNGHHLLN